MYDYEAMVRVLETRDGMDYDEAVEFLEFNTLGAYVGPTTPVVLRRMTLAQAVETCDDE